MHHAEVQIVLDSISPQGHRLTTFQLRYWRPIHSELMTHRVFSRNAGSSRARPSAAIINQVRNDPWGPLHWGANQPGMQANVELAEPYRTLSIEEWKASAREVSFGANRLLDLGAHKQIVNRLLEPFTYIDVVLTSTSFNNWFALRDHPDAQPEIRDLAQRMKQAMDASIPTILQPGEWHLPYIQPQDHINALGWCQAGRITRDMPKQSEILDVLKKLSVARCARVSYKAFDGTTVAIEKDLATFVKLMDSEPLHASPAEHQASPDEWVTHPWSRGEAMTWANPKLQGNLEGWIQYRKLFDNEFVPG